MGVPQRLLARMVVIRLLTSGYRLNSLRSLVKVIDPLSLSTFAAPFKLWLARSLLGHESCLFFILLGATKRT